MIYENDYFREHIIELEFKDSLESDYLGLNPDLTAYMN